MGKEIACRGSAPRSVADCLIRDPGHSEDQTEEVRIRVLQNSIDSNKHLTKDRM